jgi:hypothetical protein
MAKGGVYLPMPEHIGLFCQSISFVQCHQYVIGCQSIREAIGLYHESFAGDRRRQFHRVKEEVPVSIVRVDVAGKKSVPFSATTLDMSLEGIRIQTQEELLPDMKVFFAFDGEFSVPNWKGVGEVRWTKKFAADAMFVTGMSIVDNESYHAIGQHIGVPGFPVVY